MASPKFDVRALNRDIARLEVALKRATDTRSFRKIQRDVTRKSFKDFQRVVKTKVRKDRGALRRSIKIVVGHGRRTGEYYGRCGYVPTKSKARANTPKSRLVTGEQIYANEFGTDKVKGNSALLGTWDSGWQDRVFNEYRKLLARAHDQVFREIARRSGMRVRNTR